MAFISKTDYLLWRECPKNAWLRLHKPETYYTSEIAEFEKALIESGIEVEETARGLFPGGDLIEGRDDEARLATQQLIEAGAPTVFQPLFERDGYAAAIDVLQHNRQAGGFILHEIKSSTKIKEDHLYDVAFQTLLLRSCGLKVESVSIIHLNPEYVRSGDLDLARLFMTSDQTKAVDEVSAKVTSEMKDARAYLLSDKEPTGHCSCIYKGRSRHCTTFGYSNPEAPEYGVHDIARIGNSPKKLKEMVDAGIFTLDRIPTHIALTDIQQAQVRAYNSGQTAINKQAIVNELKGLSYPLQFIDYETCPSAIPLFDGFSPYNHIPFQYSLHITRTPTEEPTHKEFLCTERKDPTETFVASLQENLDPTGSIIVWHKAFESARNKEMAQRLPARELFLANINARIYDLKEVFSKQFYVHKDLWGKVSIKNVLPVLAPNLNYSSLEIQEGGAASVAWRNITSGQLRKDESGKLCEALKKYCGLDSYAMYAIWRALRDAVAK